MSGAEAASLEPEVAPANFAEAASPEPQAAPAKAPAGRIAQMQREEATQALRGEHGASPRVRLDNAEDNFQTGMLALNRSKVTCGSFVID